VVGEDLIDHLIEGLERLASALTVAPCAPTAEGSPRAVCMTPSIPRVQRPTMDKDPLDVDLALERLTAALPLQLRSAAAYTMAAGAITGFEYVGLSDVLWRFAEADLADARRLVEKIVTLGGEPADGVARFTLPRGGDAIVERLIELERETIEALQDTIPATGHTGDSEALEHRLEHIIMRKQEQVDTLLRALARPEA
jgi:bacterioferritin (cytochrome b1)